MQEVGKARRYWQSAVLAALILALVGIAAERIWTLRAAAERRGVQWTVAALRTAVSLEVARRAVASGLASVAALRGSNPMELLNRPPADYGGLEQNGNNEPAAGEWRFDPQTGELRYRYRFADTETRFRIALQYLDADGDGVFEHGTDQLQNVVLEETRKREHGHK